MGWFPKNSKAVLILSSDGILRNVQSRPLPQSDKEAEAPVQGEEEEKREQEERDGGEEVREKAVRSGRG